MSFFEELKRRNVFRVGIAYVIVAWLLLQVADTLGPALLLPEWFQSGVVFILILGFPLAIIFAWAFEVTPEGLKREKDVDRARSITRQTGQKLNVTIIALLSVAVIYFALDKFVVEHDHDVEKAASGEPSIAVLPFANMSDDVSNEFFADGITEELLNLLAKIPELQVTSRTSAFQFKDKDLDIPTIARQLDVEHVLEGSVRKSGMKVRITAQLINAATDKHVWSETYDRELDDVFAIQDEIAREVVDVLQVTLLGAAPHARTTDTDAYALYLEGLHFIDLDTPKSWPLAKALFEEAIAIDPGYAPAWFGRAKAMREIANWGDYDLDEGTELAREWLQHAVELDPELAEGWALLGRISLIYDWDWEAARGLIDRGLAAGPNNVEVLSVAGRYHQVLGQLDKQMEYLSRALALDPLSNVLIRDTGLAHHYRGEPEDALALFLKNESLHGRDAWPGDVILTLIVLGREDEAQRYIDALAGWNSEFGPTFVRAFAFSLLGRQPEAATVLQRVIDERGIPLSYQVAEMYALQGNVDKAFEWLEIGYETRDGGLTYLLVDRFLVSLHGDARWRPLLRKMNLLEYWDAMPGH